MYFLITLLNKHRLFSHAVLIDLCFLWGMLGVLSEVQYKLNI